jgi:hypothetical protein
MQGIPSVVRTPLEAKQERTPDCRQRIAQTTFMHEPDEALSG